MRPIRPTKHVSGRSCSDCFSLSGNGSALWFLWSHGRYQSFRDRATLTRAGVSKRKSVQSCLGMYEIERPPLVPKRAGLLLKCPEVSSEFFLQGRLMVNHERTSRRTEVRITYEVIMGTRKSFYRTVEYLSGIVSSQVFHKIVTAISSI